MKRPRRARGFTLVELLSVMTILAILSAMAAPVMADMVVRYRIDGLRTELMQSIQQSRAEAMVRGNTVTLRRTAGCATALVDSNDWSCGWVAFVDMDADGQEEAGDTRLQVISLSRLVHRSASIWRALAEPPSAAGRPAHAVRNPDTAHLAGRRPVFCVERAATAQGTYPAVAQIPADLLRVEGARYTVTVVTTATTFTLTATPSGRQAADACGIFRLDHTGARSQVQVAGQPVPASADECWSR